MTEIAPGLSIGPVVCGLCGHNVERVTFYEDPSTMELVMVAHCHGAKDERRISDRPMSLADAKALEAALSQGGVAFDETKLLKGNS